MSIVTSLTLSTTVFAGDTQSINEEQVADATEVIYETPASYTVTLPKYISINNSTGNGSYELAVEGYIGGNEYITVVPKDTDNSTAGINITLEDISGAASDLRVDIEQTKTRFESNEISVSDGVSTNGTLTVTGTPEKGTTYKGTMEFLIECSASGSDYINKVNLFSNLKFYGAGDSIMEGHGNNYKGVLDYLTESYGGTILNDYSISGTFLSIDGVEAIDGEPEVLTPIPYQLAKAVSRSSFEPWDDNTVIIFDGGGNDILNMDRAGTTLDATPTEFGDNPSLDIVDAFAVTYSMIDTERADSDADALIVFLVPVFRDVLGTETEYAAKIKNIASECENLVYVDFNEFIELEDFQSDGIHLKDSGYKKVTKAIGEAIYKHYTN